MKKKIILLLSLLILLSCSNEKGDNVKKETAEKIPTKAKVGDKYIFTDKIEHKQNRDYIFELEENKLRVFIKVFENDIETIDFVYDDGKSKKEVMKKIGGIGSFEYYYLDIELEQKDITYNFVIKDDVEKYYYGEKPSENKKEFIPFLYTFNSKKIGEKSKSEIYYQIFLDRFFNGNKENDPIFNEYGPISFNENKKYLSNGIKKRNLIDRRLWGKEDTFGNFKKNDWTKNWYENLEWEKKARTKNTWDNHNTRHYGGDLQGIIKKIDYLEELGIENILLSPIFYSKSNHKYDTIDFRHISPDLGVINQIGIDKTNIKNVFSKKNSSEYKLLNQKKIDENNMGENLDPKTWLWTESDLIALELIKEVHKKEMKIYFDLNIGHTSNENFIFETILKEGPKSKYVKWYLFNDWNKVKKFEEKNKEKWNPGVLYKGNSKVGTYIKDKKNYRRKWIKVSKNLSEKEKSEIYTWNLNNVDYEKKNNSIKTPKLNLKNKEVQKYIIEILKRWSKGIEEGVDGFHLDGANEINIEFLRKIKKVLESENKLLIADIYQDLTNNLSKEKYDILSNYNLVENLLALFVNKEERNKLSLEEFMIREELNFLKFSENKLSALLNILGTIHTDRIYSMMINSDREYDQKNNITLDKEYLGIRPDLYDETAVLKFKSIILLQMTMPGSPLIYYGDELGMWGADNPNNTKPMFWKEIMPYDNETDLLTKYKDKDLGENAEIDEVNHSINYPVEINEELKNWYKALIKLRKENPDLYSFGKLEFLKLEEKQNYLIYKRVLEEKEMLIIINLSSKELKKEITIENTKTYEDVLNEKEAKYDVIDGKIEIKVEANSTLILLKLK